MAIDTIEVNISESMKKLSLIIAILLTAAAPGLANSVKEKRAEAYKEAKSVMSPDLYLVYRVADRIITTNEIKRPIRVAVRSNVDCEGMLGIDAQGNECRSIELLPKIDKATNFDIWAAQVVGTMSGQANAKAFSNAGTIFLNVAMLKELTGKIDQVACVVAHELAHVTQNHSNEKQKKQLELDAKTALKVSESVASAWGQQNGYVVGMALLGGISAAAGGSTYSAESALNNLRLSALLTRPAIAKAALSQSPRIGEAMNKMQGLSENFANYAMKRISFNLRDHSLEYFGFSRQLEYEADLLGVDYAATAGFDPKECKKIWTETFNHDEGKLIKRLLPKGVSDPYVSASKDGAHSSMSLEEIRKAAMESTIENNRREEVVDEKPDYEKVPEDVMQSLLSTHPDGKSRAAAIGEHISQRSRLANLSRKGMAKLDSIFVRNWSYDEDSDSVVISDNFTSPDRAGSKDSGITGIDVDKSLGF